jgi:hypothetical protein
LTPIKGSGFWLDATKMPLAVSLVATLMIESPFLFVLFICLTFGF